MIPETISYKGQTLTITDIPIKDGDYCYNIYTGDIDICIRVFDGSGLFVVQFQSGMRATLKLVHYRRAARKFNYPRRIRSSQ